MKNTALLRVFAIIALSAMIAAGCTTEKRFILYQSKEPVKAAGHCAVWYPVKDSVAPPKIKYIPGPVVYVPGEKVYANCDSIIALNKKNEANGLPDVDMSKVPCPPCPPSTFQHDTVNVEILHYIENTAKMTYLQGQLDKANKDRDKYKDKFEEWRKKALYSDGILLFLFLATILYFYLKLKKKEAKVLL